MAARRSNDDPLRSVHAAEAPASSLERLDAEIVNCRACPRLVVWREEVAAVRRAAFRDEVYWGRPVPGFGDSAARLVVVGLAPAAHGANRTGRVFTGDRSGDWLFRALHRSGFANQPTSTHRADGLVLHGARVTAAVRCAPPQNTPTPQERDRCRPFLERELAALPSPLVFVALGAFAFEAVCALRDARPRPRFGHGCEVVLPGPPGAPADVLVGSYHPSQQNTFTGRLTEAMLDAVFARARCLVDELPDGPAEG